MIHRPALFTALALTLSLALPPSLHTQEVRGTVTDAATGAPIEGGLVRLVDEGGTLLPQRLTGTGGAFRLSAPHPGQFRVQAERIGYRLTTSEPIEISGGPPAELHLTIETQPLALTGITVEGTRQCQVRQDIGEAAARLWQEARRALTATALTSEEEVLRFRLTRWRRELDPERLTILEEDRSTRTGASTNPIQSRPAEELEELGYIRPDPEGGHFYFAPDARVLLSDAFQDHHCFTVEEGDGENRGLIGLGFEPVPGRTIPDVEGVLWLDPETAALRHLELRHTRHPYRVPTRDLGARVEFEELPNGAWIVRRWWIRMPMVGLVRSQFGDRDLENHQLLAILEEGGEISQVQTRGRVAAAPAGGVIHGQVTDSTAVGASEGIAASPGPLANARVALSGTSYVAVTDDQGRFWMDGIPEGTYRAFVNHPVLDSLAINSPAVEVRIPPVGSGRGTPRDSPEAQGTVPPASDPAEVEIHLGLPSAPTILRQHCTEIPTEAGALVGQVLDGEGRPARDARVEVTWSAFRVAGGARTVIQENSDGLILPVDTRARFRLCDAPAHIPVRIRALIQVDGRERTTPALTLEIPERGLAARVLRFPDESPN